MSGLFLSRIRLRQEAPVAALARLLVPVEVGAQAAAAHRLVWALFADGPERRRDFLWRQDQPGDYLALSARLPQPLDDIFCIRTKEFAPVLAPGDRLAFRLHANPVVALPQGPGQRGKRADVVMQTLHGLPACACRNAAGAGPLPEHCPLDWQCRAEQRLAAVVQAGRAWLARQGAAHGFQPDGEVAVDGYETMRLPRDDAKRPQGIAGGPSDARPARKRPEPIRYGVLDFEGVLTVTDPTRFLAALPQGFGRARAFGCGLMLIRRAP